MIIHHSLNGFHVFHRLFSLKILREILGAGGQDLAIQDDKRFVPLFLIDLFEVMIHRLVKALHVRRSEGESMARREILNQYRVEGMVIGFAKERLFDGRALSVLCNRTIHYYL